MIIPGRRTRAAVLANRFAPALADTVARRRMAKAQSTFHKGRDHPA
ncbi:hypothetical protein [Mycobacterium sp. NPDC006124]